MKTFKAAITAREIDRVRNMLRLRPELVNMNLSAIDDRPLHYAVFARNVDMVRLLLEHGGNAHMGMHSGHWNYPSALAMAEGRGYEEIVRVIRAMQPHPPEGTNRTPQPAAPPELRAALKSRNEDQLIAFLHANAEWINANFYDGTLMHFASAGLMERVVRWLLDHGADVNVQVRGDWTPMEVVGFAALPEDPDTAAKFDSVIQLLLLRGARQTARWAVLNKNVEWLRARHAEGTLENPLDGGEGLLSLAVRYYQPDLLRLLLDFGLDCAPGDSRLESAAAHRQVDIRPTLRHGFFRLYLPATLLIFLTFKTQERIISNIIAEHRRPELAEKLRTARVDQRPLVHRAQLLLALKLILAFAPDNGGNEFRTRDERDVLGELALIINSLFDFENLKGLDSLTLGREMAAQMSPLFELNNPEPLGNGMVRMHTMLGELYAPHTWQKVVRTDAPNVAGQLERIFTIVTGTNFTETQDLTFAIYAFYSGHAADILAGTKDLVMRPDHPDNIVSARWLRRCLDNASFQLQNVQVDSVDRGRPYLLDYTIFRQYPIWRINPDQYVCIDPYFVVERLTGGTYWTIINALAGPTPEDDERTLACSRLWGRLFEEYVLRTFADIYGTTLLSPYQPQPCYDDGEEAFDAIIQSARR